MVWESVPRGGVGFSTWAGVGVEGCGVTPLWPRGMVVTAGFIRLASVGDAFVKVVWGELD